jgi:FAD/FMN-containing dehydrogenase/Fe-S oxidoreductase
MTALPVLQPEPSAKPTRPVAPASPQLPRDLARELASAVRGEVRVGLHDRLLYATDASIYQVEPMAVVIPADADDALRAARFCARNALPMLPRGGGTSLAGQCVNRAVVIDLSSTCTRVLGLDTDARRVRVEPGVTIDDLNDHLRPTGLFFAPDPATARQANIGGVIGNNAAGSHSILYGRTSENVAALDVMLGDGRRVTLSEGAALRDPLAAELTTGVVEIVRRHERAIRERFPKTLRRSAGYQLDVILQQLDSGAGDLSVVNLAPLLVGSEGTLAMTLGAELILHPIPRAKGLAVIAFDDLDAAIAAVLPLLELRPAAVELLDDLIIDLARANREQARHLEVLPQPAGGAPLRAVLYCEFFADAPARIAEHLQRVQSMFAPGSVRLAATASEMASAWALRKAGEPLLHGIPGHRKPLGFVEDNAVPPEHLAEFVRRFRAIVEDEGTRASFYAHASVGVLHVRPLLDLRDPADQARMHRIASRAAALAKSLGGVMSGEHGDGRVRGPLLPDFFGPELMDAFRAVKALFDPANLLNPGNIVEPKPLESISQLVRVRPRAQPVEIPDVQTYFDYSDQSDFAHAVEMCNGAGVCRKKTGGVMCPSYMATLDERHSTRGRGNALRLAISGQVSLSPGSAAWADGHTLDTLDLCLSCKACKTECPSNVDVARLKAEYLAQGYRARGGAPRASRVMAAIDQLSKAACIAPGITNWANGLAPVRSLARRVLGIDTRRSLPRFARPLWKRWPRKPAFPVRLDAPEVLLLSDTFTTHNEPHIGLDAKKLLEAFGYRVVLFNGDDYARAAISLGLLPQAMQAADALLERLRPWVVHDDRCIAQLALEPSCLSAIKDDWLSLKLDAPLADRRRLADSSFLLEQFLFDQWDTHPRRPGFSRPAGPVLLHAHCHQKALWGAGSTLSMLRRAFPDHPVTLIESTCCGMAGSFGYTEPRYDLSMKIGELSLFPALRAAPADAILVAPGTSCRHQIHDGTTKQAIHPVQLLAAHLDPASIA